MAEIDGKIVNKLMQAMYLGQTTVTKKEELELKNVIELLGLSMPLQSKVDDDSSSESEASVKVSKKKKGEVKSQSSSDEESSTDPPLPKKKITTPSLPKKKPIKSGEKVRTFKIISC